MDQNPDDAEWARLVYKNQIDGIESAKRRQWLLTNYILLLYAAIIGFANLYSECPNKTNRIGYYLFILANFINSIGIYYLLNLHLAVCTYRSKLLHIGDKYECLFDIDLIADKDIGFKKHLDFTICLIVLLLAGLVLVYSFLYRPLGDQSFFCYLLLSIAIQLTIISLSFILKKCEFNTFTKAINKQ